MSAAERLLIRDTVSLTVSGFVLKYLDFREICVQGVEIVLQETHRFSVMVTMVVNLHRQL